MSAIVSLECVLFLSVCLAAREPLKVELPQGVIFGKEMSMIRTQVIHAYLGIPYAKPPLGELRFAPPDTKNLPTWNEPRNATTFQPSCLQPSGPKLNHEEIFFSLFPESYNETSEDCLYLNVFVPRGLIPPDGFAVMVWFHPGNFTTGNTAIWDPFTMVHKQRIIVVTVSYRLNVMGFFTSMDGEAPGNYGLMDQSASLEWIKANIKSFNGNPDNVCIAGHGKSGGVSVGLHLISPYSKSLFHKAITMSGNSLFPMIKNAFEENSTINSIQEYFRCYRFPTSDLLSCLRKQDAATLVEYACSLTHWYPIYDSGLSETVPAFIPDMPLAILERGDFEKVPILTGYTDMEDVLDLELDSLNPEDTYNAELLDNFIKGVVSEDLQAGNNDSCSSNHDHANDAVSFYYRPPPSKLNNPDVIKKAIVDVVTDKRYGAKVYLEASLISKFQPTFVYRFDMKPRTSIRNIPEWVTVPHLFDLIYVWGLPYWSTLMTDIDWDSGDRRIADIIMNFWANFVKSSNPTQSGIYAIKWDEFKAESPGILIIDRSFNMSDDGRIDYKAFEFWNDYYLKVLNMPSQCCNATDSSSISLSVDTNLINIYPIIILWFVSYSVFS